MNRTHLWLGGALLVQIALIAVLRAPGSSAAGAEPRPFIAALAGIEPSRIELVDEGGESLEIVRDGEGWSLPAAEGFPADAEKIGTLLEDLTALEVRRPLVRSARHHDTFRVADDDSVGRLRIWGDGADAPAVDLILGSASNYRATHARLADEDAVYEVEGLAPFDLRPRREAWVRKSLTDVAPADVVGLRVTNATGTLPLELGDDGWTLDGTRVTEGGLEVDPAAVDALLGAATSVRIVDSAGRLDAGSFGLDAPAVDVEIRLRDGRTSRLRIGDAVPDDEGKRHATVDGLDFAVTVWESGVRSLLDASRDGVMRPSTAADPDAAG